MPKKYGGEGTYRKCEHEWVYSNILLLSNPPQETRMCSKCKKWQRKQVTETEWQDE